MLNYTKNKDKILYVKRHRKAFRIIEKQLLGHNTIRSLFHDLDKFILLHFFKESNIQRLHRHYARHHDRAKTRSDYIQMVIDWECARYTKPDKPLNARDTLYKFYPQLTDAIEPILIELGL